VNSSVDPSLPSIAVSPSRSSTENYELIGDIQFLGGKNIHRFFSPISGENVVDVILGVDG
jgi:hypothetical protein